MSNAIAKVERWQLVHDELVRNGRQRAALDADEARWLREAEQLQIWKAFGMVSMVDYLERVLGYAPRTSQQRMSVARALADLPELTAALATGELPFSAIRELTRVATHHTEAAWRAAAQDKNLREIEQLVSGRKPGDLPTDPPDDDARLHTIHLDEVSAASFALWRQARQSIDRARGSHTNNDELVRLAASAILDGTTTSDPARAKNQIHYTVCQLCDRAWQDAAGATIRVDDATLAQARCDAQHVSADTSKRATQDIPPRIRREIFRRDHGRCQTPGCRSSWGLEIHHIIAREQGGTHETSNLTLRCGACHRAHHLGQLVISGTAPTTVTTIRSQPHPRITALRPRHHPRRPARTSTLRSLEPTRSPHSSPRGGRARSHRPPSTRHAPTWAPMRR